MIVTLRECTFPALVVSSDTGRRKAGQDILKPGEADTCAASAHQLQSSHARQPQHQDTLTLLWLLQHHVAFQCLYANVLLHNMLSKIDCVHYQQVWMWFNSRYFMQSVWHIPLLSTVTPDEVLSNVLRLQRLLVSGTSEGQWQGQQETVTTWPSPEDLLKITWRSPEDHLKISWRSPEGFRMHRTRHIVATTGSHGTWI